MYRAIQFVGVDRKRRTIRLGALPEKDVEAIRERIALLEVNRKLGQAPDASATAWLGRIDRKVYATLAAGGLVENRSQDATTLLGPYLDGCIAKREALMKAGKIHSDTVRIERLVRACLVDKFGRDKPLTSFTEGDAEDFRDFLLTEGSRPVKKCGTEIVIKARKPLSEATTRKRCSIASKMFSKAVRAELICRNPFDTDAVPKANVATKRIAYIEAADARAVLAKLPTNEWKLLFALCRWGGMRIGEPRLLTWADVLFDERRILVHCQKTDHIIGHETRLVPIFPELAPLLDQQFEQAPVGSVYVLPMLQERTDASLRKTLLRAADVAGVKRWPRLWHNLRATRQNELLEAGFKRKAVCSWMGNSAEVAHEHYERATDVDFDRATAPESAPPAEKRQETAGKA